MVDERHGAWCDGDETSPAWEGRAGGLDAWAVRADAEHERAADETTRRVVALDGCVRSLRHLARRTRSLPWAAVLMSLGLVAWVTARRLVGADVDEDDIAAAFRASRSAPFGGARSVLAAARSTATIGVGPIAYQLAEDTDQARALRGRARVGTDVMYSNPTRSGGAQPKALGMVERRVDAAWALRASGLPAEDLALLGAVDLGEQRSKARRTKAGIEEAVQRVDVAEAARRLGESEVSVRKRIRRVRRLLGVALEERSARCDDPLVRPRRRPRARVRDEASAAVEEIAGVPLPEVP